MATDVPVPGTDETARYLAASYDLAGMNARHLREFVAMLDAAGVPDEAPAYVMYVRNRDLPMVTLRVDLADDEDALRMFGALGD